MIEISYQAASAPGANDGRLELWVNDTLVDTLANLDNDTRKISYTSLGAVANLDAGTSGTIYFDELESRIANPIGPVAAEPRKLAIADAPVPSLNSAHSLLAGFHARVALDPIFYNASFTYDADGKRVKSTLQTNIDTTTTYFVGNYYEVTGSTVTKYYYAGTQRIAMRQGSTLYYLFGDHLGSTSLTTDASGNMISQMKYTAWGEVRYESGTTPTDTPTPGKKAIQVLSA